MSVQLCVYIVYFMYICFLDVSSTSGHGTLIFKSCDCKPLKSSFSGQGHLVCSLSSLFVHSHWLHSLPGILNSRSVVDK